MTRISRRHFIGSAVGLGVLGAIGGKTFWDFRSRKNSSAGREGLYYDISVQSLFCSASTRLQSEIHHQGSHVDAGPRLEREYDQRMTYAFFNPAGKEIHRTGSLTPGLSSRLVEIPQDLGWSSVIAVQSIDARSGLSPNIEVSQFMTTRYQNQSDSHHGVLWRPQSVAYQVLRAPEDGDGVLLGLTNPMGAASGAELQIFNSQGRQVVSKKMKIDACASRYYTLGAVPDAPAIAETLKLPAGETFLVRIETEIGAAFPMNTWWFGAEKGFTTSHGSYTMTGGSTDYQPLRERALVDVVSLGVAPTFKITEASRVVVPNLTKQDLQFSFTLTQASGHQIRGERTIKARSAEDWDLGALKPQGDSESSLSTLVIETRQPNFPVGLVKIWNFSNETLSLQHARPDDHLYLEASKELTDRTFAGLKSDNWVSSGPWTPANSTTLMVYNMDAQVLTDVRVQSLGSEGILVEAEFPPIASHAFASSTLNSLKVPQKAEALRIFSSQGVLRASLHEFQDGVLSQSVHATSKLKFPGLMRRPPPLIDPGHKRGRSYANDDNGGQSENGDAKRSVHRRRNPPNV